jgi:hypothetical protein
MIALPSIAFEGFSGSAKGVTARRVGGRNILSVKSWPTGATTNAQVARRTSMSKISKSWKLLTNDQMREWDRLAEHTSGASAFGQKAEISGMNLYIRLNVNRAMAGEALLSTAPASNVAVPNLLYTQIVVTPDLVVLAGIKHESSPYKLVLKMSASQSAGISNGWSKTVIITPGMEDDWGEADVTTLYLKTIGVQPVPGQKVFIEAYWLDTSTGFAGQSIQEYAVVAGDSPYQRRVKATMDNLRPDEESHVAALDVDFSTGAPVAQFNAECLGHSNVASSEVYLDQPLPSAIVGTGIAIGRSCEDSGHINAQSYLVYMYNRDGASQLTFAHRGGPYFTHTEVFGTGIIY